MKQNPKQTLIYQKSGIFSSTFFLKKVVVAVGILAVILKFLKN